MEFVAKGIKEEMSPMVKTFHGYMGWLVSDYGRYTLSSFFVPLRRNSFRDVWEVQPREK